MKVGARRYHRSMAGTVHDLIAVAKVAAANAQQAITAGRATAARIANTKTASPATGIAGEAPSTGEPQAV